MDTKQSIQRSCGTVLSSIPEDAGRRAARGQELPAGGYAALNSASTGGSQATPRRSLRASSRQRQAEGSRPSAGSRVPGPGPAQAPAGKASVAKAQRPRDGKLESAPAVEPARTALGKALMAAQDPSSDIEQWFFGEKMVIASTWSDRMGEATRALLAVATQAGKSSEWVTRGLHAILRAQFSTWSGFEGQYVQAVREDPPQNAFLLELPPFHFALFGAEAFPVFVNLRKGLGAAADAFMQATPSPDPTHIAQFIEGLTRLDEWQQRCTSILSIYRGQLQRNELPRSLTDLLVSAGKSGWSLASCSALVDGYRAADCPDPAKEDGQAFVDWARSKRKFIGWAADELFGKMPEPTPEDMGKPMDERTQARVTFIRTMEGRLLPPRLPTPAPALPATSVPGQLEEAVIGKSATRRAEG